MSKIEEALAKATRRRQGRTPVEEERRGGDSQKVSPEPTEPVLTELEEVELDQLQLVENRLVVASAPTIGTSDAYRQLRTSLMMVTQDRRRSYVVTSSLQADGKSLTALNLAFAIAQEIHLDAVLVDGDLRRPSLSSSLGLEPRPGLSDYLSDSSVSIGEVVARLKGGPVFVSSGKARLRNTSELLGSERMRQFCQDLKRWFPDAVLLFDSSPVLPTPDAMALTQWLDGAIFVVSAGKTSRKALADGVRQFGANRIVGVVVNQSDRGGYGYPYRYYYSYRYGSYENDQASDDKA